MTLAYTMQQLLTQQAVIDRDKSKRDEFGGELKVEREVIETVRCRFWWWREGTSRGGPKEFATPQRTINLIGGGIIVPKETDIEEGDHIDAIQDLEGNTLVDGPFRVTGVEEWENHIECNLLRP